MLQREDLGRDLRALRRHLWFPAAAIVVALAAGAGLALARGSSSEAQFRLRIDTVALAPLYGPPVLPNSFDYAAFAIDPQITGPLAQRLRDQNIPGADDIAGRLKPAPRLDQPSVDFTVKGDHALAIATAWRDVFTEVLPAALPELERRATVDYQHQLDHAANELMGRQAEAASGDDTAANLALAAAKENYQVAQQLLQSYDVVGQTMHVNVTRQSEPHLTRSGPLDWAARLGAALAFGLVVGVIGAVALEARSRPRGSGRREAAPAPAYETTSPPS